MLDFLFRIRQPFEPLTTLKAKCNLNLRFRRVGKRDVLTVAN